MDFVTLRRDASRMAGNKNTLYKAIAGVIIIVVIIAVVFFYWQTHTNLVKITKFSERTTGSAGEYIPYTFSVIVKNQGINTVDDVTVLVRILGNTSELGRDSHLLLSLASGQETPETDYSMFIEMNATIGVTLTAVATLNMSGIILDQVSISLS